MFLANGVVLTYNPKIANFFFFFACVCLECLQMNNPRVTAIQKQVLLNMFPLAFAFPICETGIRY